jgi:hypothetical protein
MGMEGESIGWVKFQPVPASSEHERNSDPVYKTFSTKRFSRNTERVIGE